MLKHILLSLLVLLASGAFLEQKRTNQKQNLINILPNPPAGSSLPSKVYAGEVHYSRIPIEYWQHRIQMIKAMGFNALSVYIMWNFHQVKKGVFDYTTKERNITFFLSLAKKYDMKILIRPGPYVCAEWDFGGMPARLLGIPGLKLRANNNQFLDEVRVYFKSLVPILTPFLSTNGGPIIMLQIENEYGFYGNDKTYIQALRAMWRDLNFVSDQYYVDTVENLQKCHWNGANIGINNAISEEMFTYARTFEKTGFIFGGEVYSGWLTHWGEPFAGKSMQKYVKQFKFLIQNNHSFSMYMVHGGSNFGLSAGANQGKTYIAHITSYDYDAPINENGMSNDKFTTFLSLVTPYVDWTIPPKPQPIPSITISPIKMKASSHLLSNLPYPLSDRYDRLIPFESGELQMYNQGIVVYATTIGKASYNFKAVVHDFALVYLDGTRVAILNRTQGESHNFTANCQLSECTLMFVIQAMGHINFDHDMEKDHKGLIQLQDNHGTKYSWRLYKIPLNEGVPNWSILNPTPSYPLLSKANFTLDTLGDTYFDLSSYQKGYVWVNGHLLGRYWNIGPQKRLFCPGAWLVQGGNNQIVVLDLLQANTFDITGYKTLKSDGQTISEEAIQ